MCVKICISSTSNPGFNGYNKVSCVNTGLASLLLSSLPGLFTHFTHVLKTFSFQAPDTLFIFIILHRRYQLFLFHLLCEFSISFLFTQVMTRSWLILQLFLFHMPKFIPDMSKLQPSCLVYCKGLGLSLCLFASHASWCSLKHNYHHIIFAFKTANVVPLLS